MCALIGLLAGSAPDRVNQILKNVWELSHARGRDGRGLYARMQGGGDALLIDTERYVEQIYPFYMTLNFPHTLIANLRAEPTTEYVKNKRAEDQQPYQSGKWTIVHNGTIANDKELRTYKVDTTIDSAAIAELLDKCDSPFDYPSETFARAIPKLKGSYAILAMHKDSDALFYASNYRPLWYVIIPEVGAVVASAREYLPQQYAPRMLPPYTLGAFKRSAQGIVTMTVASGLRKPSNSRNKALVVCSGGLDSVVAARYVQKVLDMDVTLLNFQYGSRAQDPEVQAIHEVARRLGVGVIYQEIGVYRKEDSPLLQADSKIAGGEAGAEFAYEWVPARNLLMLSMATAIAEARGFETIVLGNNLEEAGAYPDNEPEFIAKFNDMLPFAVGDGKHMEVIMPVGNMMKHEIVKLGLEIDAPLDVTWSCYRAVERKQNDWDGRHSRYVHCGTCGPCFMRRTAFKINNAPEVIDYEA